ncbi:hypothetical protein [Legionella hackeliae]|uniref:Uncharacterized protein n=1 Tax=Legionella hackeliae TaxID=449 RepID=A0A0A8UN48_LEGHA|nr:hypothetical protein [Legionella hackeliae]KTD08873.1 hypothetical protein Lhac_3096 [Legionella hackeliae]CEK10305.1 protein of unknown function [Legionella hackeliae]STX47032.1 Uncharacterised protein [Legionella hackeliae]
MISFFSKAALHVLREALKTTAVDTTRVTLGTGMVMGGYHAYDKAKNAFFQQPSVEPHNKKDFPSNKVGFGA